MKLSRGEWAVLAFNLLYIGGFLAYFTLIANREFVGYILTMLALLALVAVVHRQGALSGGHSVGLKLLGPRPHGRRRRAGKWQRALQCHGVARRRDPVNSAC